MVAATNRASQETAVSYMKAMLDLYQNAYRSIPTPLNPFGMVPAPVAPRAAEPEPLTRPNHSANEAGELRRRVEELESRIAGLGAKKSGRKKTGKSRRKN